MKGEGKIEGGRHKLEGKWVFGWKIGYECNERRRMEHGRDGIMEEEAIYGLEF